MSTPPLVRARDLAVHFPIRKGLWNRVSDHVRAVDGVSFDIRRGQTLAIVGESGSGKSTTGYAVMGMEAPTAGQILIDGQDRAAMTPVERRATMRRLQIIFQDPSSALNPRMRVAECIAEPLQIHRIGTPASRAARVRELAGLVGLPIRALERLPRDFSGGQKQRIVIARALALEPELIVCDEPVSALDVSIQSQILNLLLELQQRLGLAYLFISHDLSVVRHIADDILVMQRGAVVESGSAETIFTRPSAAYTQHLLAAVPRLDHVDK